MITNFFSPAVENNTSSIFLDFLVGGRGLTIPWATKLTCNTRVFLENIGKFQLVGEHTLPFSPKNPTTFHTRKNNPCSHATTSRSTHESTDGLKFIRPLDRIRSIGILVGRTIFRKLGSNRQKLRRYYISSLTSVYKYWNEIESGKNLFRLWLDRFEKQKRFDREEEIATNKLC